MVQVLAGSASGQASRELARLLGGSLATVERKLFPDGEVYVRLVDDVRGDDVVIVQTTVPNDNLVELFLLQEAAHAAGAASIVSVVPYFAYSRQDQVFKPGEVVSAKAIAELIAVKADRFITVDPHKEHILGFFGIDAHSVSAVPELAEHLRNEGPDVILAPDKGAMDRAEACAALLGLESDHLEKTRVSSTEVRMAPKNLDVAGKTVAIIDDIISTGGTIATAAAELKAQGAERVLAACTHGLFVGDAIRRMTKGGVDAVVATDSIEGEASLASCAPAIRRGLEGILNL